MNERLIELAKQAGLKKEHGSDREYMGAFDWRQYGELIVQECATEADKQTIYCRGIPWGRWIKEHFGVKE
jgi:hypothetical protein